MRVHEGWYCLCQPHAMMHTLLCWDIFMALGKWHGFWQIMNCLMPPFCNSLQISFLIWPDVIICPHLLPRQIFILLFLHTHDTCELHELHMWIRIENWWLSSSMVSNCGKVKMFWIIIFGFISFWSSRIPGLCGTTIDFIYMANSASRLFFVDSIGYAFVRLLYNLVQYLIPILLHVY